MSTFIAAIVLLLLSGLLAPFSRNGSRFPDRLSLLLGMSGTGLGVIATVICLLHSETTTLSLTWPTINGTFALRLDGLSCVFLLPAFVIAGAGLLYGVDYWPQSEKPAGSAWIRTFYPLLAAAIAMVLVAANGVVFLIAWEIMALSGYFLVLTERDKDEAHRAGTIYLIATHAGTLALFGLFALLGESACLFHFPATGTLATASTTIFLLTLIGFGFKGGIIPMHIWLPGAHSAAPSHVSALMSGVMIKTGIYGILRIMSLFQTPPAWWGWTILCLGLVSGILGVVLAIAQHDIKRLLAYHSIENIGIILLGMGIALLGKSYNQPAVAVLGLAGALLHVVNHGLFKGLLFLSAGSMIKSVGSRQMDRFGGLLRTMPVTGFFFLAGAVAICGLPPLNGFVSEWLIYLGLLQTGMPSAGDLSGVLPAVPGLAMIGGLALLCFAKVFGLSFLGTPRTDPAESREAGKAMLTAMGILFGCCLWIGLLPGTVLPFLSGALAIWTGNPMADGQLASLAPSSYITCSALLFLGILLAVLLAGRKKDAGKRTTTWGCGYNQPLYRTQYTTSSFAEMVNNMFSWVLNTGFEEKKPEGTFPPAATFKSHTPDAVLDRILIPAYAKIASLATRIRRTLHQGIIGIYLLYSAFILCLLFAYAIFYS